MAEQPSDQARPLLTMVALNTPSLPEGAALTGELRTIPGIAIDLGSVESEGRHLGLWVGEGQCRRCPHARSDSLVES